MLRWIIVEAARVAVNHDMKMRSFHERVKHRRGDQKATIAVANKMLKIIWFMLTRREPYESRNEKRYRQELNWIATQQNHRLATGIPGITNLDHNIFHECAPSDPTTKASPPTPLQ